MSIPVGKQTLLTFGFGSSWTGLAATVQYRITKADNTLLTDWTNAAVFELGHGNYAAPYTFTVEVAYVIEARETVNNLYTRSATVHVSTDTDAIKAKTDNLPVDPADASDIAAAFTALEVDVDAIQAKTDLLPSDPADESALEAVVVAVQTSLATLVGNAQTALDTLTSRLTNQRAANLDHLDADITGIDVTVVADLVPLQASIDAAIATLALIKARTDLISRVSVTG